MSIVRRILPSYEATRAALIVLIATGALALLLAGFLYVMADNALRTTPTIEQAQDIYDMNNPTNAQILAIYESRRRDAFSRQSYSLIIGGVGLAAIGIGWLGYDLTERRRKAQARQTA